MIQLWDTYVQNTNVDIVSPDLMDSLPRILSQLISLELEINSVLLRLSSPVPQHNNTLETVLSLQNSAMAAVIASSGLKEISETADNEAKNISEYVHHITDGYKVLNSVLEQLNASREQAEDANDTTVAIKVSQEELTSCTSKIICTIKGTTCFNIYMHAHRQLHAYL